VKSNAVLNSTKYARLTTNIARKKIEVAGLRQDYAEVKAALRHEQEILAATELSMELKERCDALVEKIENGTTTEAEVIVERDAIVAQMVPVGKALITLAKVPGGGDVAPVLLEFQKLSLKKQAD
jgi:hypothetical protein